MTQGVDESMSMGMGITKDFQLAGLTQILYRSSKYSNDSHSPHNSQTITNTTRYVRRSY